MSETRTRFLSRDEAIEILQDLAESDILKERISDNLEEIALLLRHELYGEHFWNQPYDSADKLGVAYREDLLTPELIEEIRQQHINARFIPAPNEVEELKTYYMEMRECDEESEESYRTECEADFAFMYGINNND